VVRGDDADGRADVYGLGACLYEMLTARAPGVDPSSTIPPRALRAGVPRDLDTIVRQAMATDPDDRFQTVQAMAAALSRSATGADSTPSGELYHVPPGPAGPEVTPSRGFLRHEGRLLGWVLALVAVAAVLVAVGLTLAKDDLGNLFGDDRPSGTSGSPGTSTPATRIKVADASSFDPDGDGQENTNMAAGHRLRPDQGLADRGLQPELRPRRHQAGRRPGPRPRPRPGGREAVARPGSDRRQPDHHLRCRRPGPLPPGRVDVAD
jgi:serine/threonine protein kinase